MHRHLQFGMRENPASNRRHGSRLVVAAPSNENDSTQNDQALPSRSDRQDHLSLASGARKNAASPRAATGEMRTGRSEFAMDTSTNEISLPLSERRPEYDFLDCKQLAERWNVPETWIRERVRRRSADPLPHVRFGKYVRFRWGAPELEEWAQRRIVQAATGKQCGLL